jgi:hypothetical protein
MPLSLIVLSTCISIFQLVLPSNVYLSLWYSGIYYTNPVAVYCRNDAVSCLISNPLINLSLGSFLFIILSFLHSWLKYTPYLGALSGNTYDGPSIYHSIFIILIPLPSFFLFLLPFIAFFFLYLIFYWVYCRHFISNK